MIRLQKAGITKRENFTNRINNIKFIAGLDRVNYSFANPAPLLNIRTINNEIISISYPGKETTASTPKIWDFRPILRVNNIFMKDLTFGDIWHSIGNFINSFNLIDRPRVSILLSRIFYKVAFYNSHLNNNNLLIFDKNLLNPAELQLFDYPINTLDQIGGNLTVSLESFILFNDLLCLNEDCKYFYIKNLKEERNITNILLFNEYDDLKNNVSWESSSGRINTFLTHINYILHLGGIIPLHTILECASRGQGIFPIQNNQNLIDILNQPI